MAEVFVGLSDEEALRLAQRHNANSHFVHKVTHRNLVRVLCIIYITNYTILQLEACRARLYRIAGQDTNSETPVPSAAWRESCKKAIIPKVRSYTNFCKIQIKVCAVRYFVIL